MDQETPTIPEVAPAAAAAAPTPAAAKPRRGVSARALNMLFGGALVLAVAGVAFAAGRMTAPASTALGNFQDGVQALGGNPRASGGSDGLVFGGAGGAGGPTIEGTVESVTETTLTLKTADGRTIQVALDGTTTYHAQTDATSSDVMTGARVLVRLALGTRNGGGNGGTSSAGDVTVMP